MADFCGGVRLFGVPVAAAGGEAVMGDFVSLSESQPLDLDGDGRDELFEMARPDGTTLEFSIGDVVECEQ